ncbi:MAG: 16S rRNA (adenine(1518)-N(6)/adenine(1519)-N(6))-dimethyltransferase RsmA [Oscillospiraceae bacterium]|nr:16S rRNA (adenine(1518)-N(6)/adenine(1519)-N(6))-dimethyltransferase RsmA [Oscillospiraceae bacterium]
MNLCDINVIKPLLQKHGFHFSKSKGQNFLTQSWVPREIADGAGIDKTCGVLEVGPGIGPLTQALCENAEKVVSVEVDTSLAPVLAETMADTNNFTLIFGDILKADIPALVQEHFQGLRPMACANLPYYITSPVLSALLESKCFESITVMVQKEVAQRICAQPGSKDYSAFSLFCQYYAQPEILFNVPPSCFIPQPKVTSAVITLPCRKAPPCPIADEKLFFRTVRASFAQRRKTLVNGLSSGFGTLSKAQIIACLTAAGLPENVRGETLGIPEFARVAEEIRKALSLQ